jgi:hypothetical protein
LTICGGRGAEEKNYEWKLLHVETVTMMGNYCTDIPLEYTRHTMIKQATLSKALTDI